MTSNGTDWKLGEVRGKCETISCEAAGSIAAGDFVSINGFNDDGQPKIITQATTAVPIGVAMYKASTGDFVQIVIRGFVKVTFGDAVAQGGPIYVHGNAVWLGTKSGAVQMGGWNHGPMRADQDTGIIFLSGGTS